MGHREKEAEFDTTHINKTVLSTFSAFASSQHTEPAGNRRTRKPKQTQPEHRHACTYNQAQTIEVKGTADGWELILMTRWLYKRPLEVAGNYLGPIPLPNGWWGKCHWPCVNNWGGIGKGVTEKGQRLGLATWWVVQEYSRVVYSENTYNSHRGDTNRERDTRYIR